MKLRIRLAAIGAASVLLLAACGGGESSSRTKNSALCYATQEDKDAAVQAAQDAFDAAMGGAPTDDSIAPTDSTVVTDTTVTPEDSDVVTDSTSATGGGYRRPAVRAASSGDTTVPPAGDGGGEGDGTLTPEQQQAQMDLETAESQPLCDESSESADQVKCTATITGTEVTDDCEEGDVVVLENEEGVAAGMLAWQLVASGTETVLAQGQFSESELYDESGSAVPYIVDVAYETNAGDEETSADRCSYTVTSTGMSWDCPNGELFHTGVGLVGEGYSQIFECTSSGSVTFAEGQDFIFYFSLRRSFFNTDSTRVELDTPQFFEVPEDVHNECTPFDSEKLDWESLPFVGESDPQTENYSFVISEDFEGPVYVKFESSADFDVDVDDMTDFAQDPCEGDCAEYVGYSVWTFSAGEYFIEIEDNSQVVTWHSNVEISPIPFDYPELPFSYESDGSETTYVLSVSETQTVVLAATAGETCNTNEDDDSENGFADPEIDITGVGIDDDDDNSGRGPGHCSASLLEIELQPGKYTVTVEDDDGEGGDITLSSSVELEQGEITWDLTTVTVSPDFTFTISVPEGGAWFAALVTADQFAVQNYDLISDEYLSAEGCYNPDGDESTDDEDCSYSAVAVINSEGDYFQFNEGVRELWKSSITGGVRREVSTNLGDSAIEVFLPAGEYTVAVMDCCDPLEEGEVSPNEYELQYGFGTFGAGSAPSVGDVKDTNADIPNVGSSANLSASLLTRDSSVSTAISSQVEVLLCDAACIEGMFATAGIADGTITVRAGGEEVVIRKGQSNAKIPVSAGASRISAVAKSADGSTTVNLGSNFTQLPEDIQASFESKSSSGDGSGFNMLYLLLLIPVLGAIFVVVRRKQASASL